MSTVAAPYGFRATKLFGSDPQTDVYAPIGYSIASGYGSSIYAGDPVKLSGTADAQGRPGLQLAALGDSPLQVVGVLAGIEYYDTVLQKPIYIQKWTASYTNTSGPIIAHIYDHEDTIFAVQANGAGSGAVDVGSDASWATGTGSNTTLQSAYTLDASTIGTGTVLSLLALNPAGSGAFDTYPDWLVLFRTHQKRGNGAAGYPIVV